MAKKKKIQIKEEVKQPVAEKAKVEEVKQAEHICPRCGAIMVVTGGGRSGSDLHCKECGLNTTKVI